MQLLLHPTVTPAKNPCCYSSIPLSSTLTTTLPPTITPLAIIAATPPPHHTTCSNPCCYFSIPLSPYAINPYYYTPPIITPLATIAATPPPLRHLRQQPLLLLLPPHQHPASNPYRYYPTHLTVYCSPLLLFHHPSQQSLLILLHCTITHASNAFCCSSTQTSPQHAILAVTLHPTSALAINPCWYSHIPSPN